MHLPGAASLECRLLHSRTKLKIVSKELPIYHRRRVFLLIDTQYDRLQPSFLDIQLHTRASIKTFFFVVVQICTQVLWKRYDTSHT